MKEKNNINLLIMYLIIIFIGLTSYIIYTGLANNTYAGIQNDTQVITYHLTQEQKFQALCPFTCIDSGFDGGYYSNLLNKCVCIRQENG